MNILFQTVVLLWLKEDVTFIYRCEHVGNLYKHKWFSKVLKWKNLDFNDYIITV